MEAIQYIGELQWPGILGCLAVFITFVASLAGCIAFFKSNKTGADSWKKLARVYFLVHAGSVGAVIGLLLFIMIGHHYEYQYAWSHVSDELPMQYIFSAFWEGQEGSFLLWMFWHMILGALVLYRNDPWADIVMAVLLAVQCVIASMLLGIYFSETWKLGSNPFLLLRDTMDAPLFNNPGYTKLLEGNGLNPLLQNYWMTIHPPTLFLGFASVTIPFCYAIGGLVRKEYTAWLKPVMPWALFSAAILGLGILMGGAWAYEALSFGGYWAWDPVENMSLVPWIVLVAAVHGNLVARKTGHSVRLTFAFYILSFLLILYSTFLTRSGILGDSSAHAFTQMGLEWQLIGFIALFGIGSTILLIQNWKTIPAPSREEQLNSREFWMFIGTLVLFFSALLITFTTSIPVYNKLFDVVGNIIGTDLSHLHRTAPVDPEAHYNRFQLWIAVFIALLTSGAQYLRYREAAWDSARKKFVQRIGISLAGSAVLGFILLQWIDATAWQYVVLVFAVAFAIVANLEYLITYIRGNIRESASVLGHLGFSLMIVGVMASGLNKHVISSNVFAQSGLIDGVDQRSHIYLIKEKPMFMNGYWVEYESDTVNGNTREFLVSYKKINEAQDTIERFSLRPNVIYNRQNTKLEATNPSTKRYLEKDIFTYVAALPAEQMDIEKAKKINDSLTYNEYPVTMHGTIGQPDFDIRLKGISMYPEHSEYTFASGDLGVQATLEVLNKETGETYNISPVIYLRENLVFVIPEQINDLNMRIRLGQKAITEVYPRDDLLPYKVFRIKQGEAFEYNGWQFTLNSIDRDASHPHYIAREGDIAVSAILTVTNDTTEYTARPMYYIRGSSPGHLKANIPDIGAHIRFENIYPQSEEFDIAVAFDPLGDIPVEVAREVPRNDIIVLQAIVFPGINLFWSGSLIMLLGLFLGMWHKLRKDRT